MVYIKRFLITFSIFLVTSVHSFSIDTSRTPIESGQDIYGPEVLSYCGGYIETYLERDWGSFILTIKISPPDGKNWILNNSNILIVDLREKDQPLNFLEFEELNTKTDKSFILKLNIKNYIKVKAKKFGVSFKKLDGCGNAEEKVGSVLKLGAKL